MMQTMACPLVFPYSNELLLAVDDINQKFCVIDTEIRVFSYKDIVGVELFEDEVQLTKTSRGSQLGGAILGGVLVGGVMLANHWFSLISVLIKQADEKDNAPNEAVKSGNDQRNVADELLKLSELMKQGIITGDEFEKQKRKLLS
jgi:hypothetical protein